jgi:hypothetical protein
MTYMKILSNIRTKETHRQSGKWGFADIFSKVVFLKLYQLNDERSQAFACGWICLNILEHK